MKRAPLKRKTRLAAKAKPATKAKAKAPQRSAAEFARVYGSKARVAWVQAQACVACGRGPCENAHTESGGMGRKADYTTIVPLCAKCHTFQHAKGWKALGLTPSRLQFLAYTTQFRYALTRGNSAD